MTGNANVSVNVVTSACINNIVITQKSGGSIFAQNYLTGPGSTNVVIINNNGFIGGGGVNNSSNNNIPQNILNRLNRR